MTLPQKDQAMSALSTITGASSGTGLPSLPSAPSAPVFGQFPGTQRPKPKSATPVSLGPNASPSVANMGYKKLIGQ